MVRLEENLREMKGQSNRKKIIAASGLGGNPEVNKPYHVTTIHHLV
jgi:hypothetical protein